ncbi:hypothetical protein [Coleofasciculus sp. FACHB-1120]|uniref:hypothetical protein n=1 Tax=Coleofasciculus sp. FACHB-1120 TaxID=2692783 RepID=UPI001686B40E|nr:hypothetical protein [Coleofasciculus sp. FACHB-1120]MBD2743780.1 hypothetical protein [Coleofasciculus sp. FACHB-1120]
MATEAIKFFWGFLESDRIPLSFLLSVGNLHPPQAAFRLVSSPHQPFWQSSPANAS